VRIGVLHHKGVDLRKVEVVLEMKKEEKSSSWKSPNKLVLCKYLLSVMSRRSVDWPKEIISVYL